jgi:hypothetical protein
LYREKGVPASRDPVFFVIQELEMIDKQSVESLKIVLKCVRERPVMHNTPQGKFIISSIQRSTVARQNPCTL